MIGLNCDLWRRRQASCERCGGGPETGADRGTELAAAERVLF